MNDDEFDVFANDYRRIHTKNVQGISGQDSDYFSRYKIRELKDRQAVSENAAWLDLGCGDGNTFRFVREFFPTCTYSGIDVSRESIHSARTRIPESSSGIFQSYDGLHIPFDDASFDIVFMACVLHHVLPEDRPALMRQCRRVLRQEGKLVVFEHNPFNPVTLKLVRDCPFDANAHLLTSKNACHLLREAGFRILSKRYTLFMPRKGIWLKLASVEKHLSWLPLGGQYYVIATPE